MTTYRTDTPRYLYLYERPSAAAFGAGQCLVGGVLHISDGVNWIASGSIQRATKIALVGDSTCFQNSTAATFLMQGPINWMLRELGYPVYYDPSDNYGIGGATTRTCIDIQLPNLVAGHAINNYQRCFISIGTNDTALSFSTRQAQTLELFNRIRDLGIIPVSVGIRPRGNDGADTTYKKSARAINQWIYQQSLAGVCEYVDISEVYADTSTAFGNIVAALSDDSLHPNPTGAHREGHALAVAYSGKLGPSTLRLATEQADVFDRVNNPYGVCLGSASNPLLIGGTTAPTGMTSVGGTWSKVSRTLTNGQTRSDPQCVLAASTSHTLDQTWTATGAWGSTELHPGDVVECRAKITVTNGVNIRLLKLSIIENDGVTSRFVTDNSDAGVAPLVDGTYTIYMKTPHITISPYAGTGNAFLNIQFRAQTVAAASGTVQVLALEARPISLVS